MCCFFDYRRRNYIFISTLLMFLFCSTRGCATEIEALMLRFYISIFVKMTTKRNSFDVLNVSFYGVYVVITFQCSNWTVCQNAYKFKGSVWTHVKWAKNWLDNHPINQFYSAINKVEKAWKVQRIDRKDWSIRHDVFYYSKGIWGNRRDCYFYKPQGLFA